MLKVLHVISNLRTADGGPFFGLHGLVSSQIKNVGVGIAYTYSNERSTAEEAFFPKEVKFHPLGPCISSYRYRLDLHAELEEIISEYDVIQMHGVWEAIYYYSVLAAKRQGRKVIITACGLLSNYGLSKNSLKKSIYLRLRGNRLIQAADAVHFSTELEKKTWGLGFRVRHEIVAPNGISLEDVPSSGLENSSKEDFVLFLSRIHPVKGLERILPFWEKHVDIPKLVIAGSGDKQYMLDLKKKFPSKRIEWIGEVYGDKKWSLFRSAKLFILPSHFESFGNVVIEALSAGTPVLASSDVALSEELKSAEMGVVHNFSEGELDRELLTEALKLKSHEFSRRSIQFVEKNYSWDAISNRWIQEYTRMASK